MGQAKKLIEQYRALNEMEMPSKEDVVAQVEANKDMITGMDKDKVVNLVMDLLGSEIPLDKLAVWADDGTINADEYELICDIAEPYVMGLEEALRPLASSSDQSKYAGLKKTVADLEAKKKAIHDKWEKEADGDKRLAMYKEISDLRDKIGGVDKQRTDMMKKFRGLRKKSA